MLADGTLTRLGDKSRELANYGPHVLPAPAKSPTSLYQAWNRHIAAAKAAFPGFRWRTLPSMVTKLVAKRRNTEPAKSARADAFMRASVAALDHAQKRQSVADSKPLLAMMSDDSSGAGLRSLLHHPLAAQFEVITSLDTPRGSSSHKQEGLGPALRRLFHRKQAIKPGFDEARFNQMDMGQRVMETRLFLRDLTLLAERAEGLVITGSSNVGRLMALLFGPEKVKQGRLHSADVRWFPTVRYQ